MVLGKRQQANEMQGIEEDFLTVASSSDEVEESVSVEDLVQAFADCNNP